MRSPTQNELPATLAQSLPGFVGAHMPSLLSELALALLSPASRACIVDPHKRLDQILEKTLVQQTPTHRLCRRCLLYLKQHYALLRHTAVDGEGRKITKKDVQGAIENLADLVICLQDMQRGGHLQPLETLLSVTTNFYYAYYDLCLQHNLSMPPKERFTYSGEAKLGSAENPESRNSNFGSDLHEVSVEAIPEQGHSMEWYKLHGWAAFLRGRTIVFTSGQYANQPCKVDRFNGNNTRCIFPDGVHYISVKVPLHWQ